MVATGATELKEVVQLGQRIKREVNKRYRLLEIEEDGLFKRMLLLKKKKYAALKLKREADGSWSEVRSSFCMRSAIFLGSMHSRVAHVLPNPWDDEALMFGLRKRCKL